MTSMKPQTPEVSESYLDMTHDNPSSILVIMTTFNRCEQTMNCLSRLFTQTTAPPLKVFVADDASTDGTPETISALDPRVTVLNTSGDLYWSRGMAVAEKAALIHRADHLLWLNDDVDLHPTALQTLLAESRFHNDRAIIVGAVIDPDSQDCSYSGLLEAGRPGAYVRALPGAKGKVNTFNGNVVLVPNWAHSKIGFIDATYQHAMADLDYGLRAGTVNVSIYVAKTYVGSCRRNPDTGNWLDRSKPRITRFRALIGRKSLPPRSYLHFMRRHGGRLWLVHWLRPYISVWMH